MNFMVIVFTLFFGLRLFAAEPMKVVDLNKANISKELRTDLELLLKADKSPQPSLWGALYDCQYYCKFVGFLGGPLLVVELPESVQLASLRFIHRDSPAFLNLFGKEEIGRATAEMFEKQKGFRRHFQTTEGEGEPEDPRDPANYWFSYSFEPNYRQVDFKTEFSLQQNFKTNPFIGYRGFAAITPNLRFKIKGYKIYSSFFAALETFSQRQSQVSDNFSINSTEYEYGMRLLTPIWGGFIGLGGFILKHKDVASSESIQGYSTEFEAKGISLSGDFEKYKFDLSYSLNVAVFDSQAYRTQPFTGQWMRIRTGYCREKIMLGVLEFDSCIGYLGTLNQQKARLSPNIDFTGQPIAYEEIYHGVFLTFSGGDRLREKIK